MITKFEEFNDEIAQILAVLVDQTMPSKIRGILPAADHTSYPGAYIVFGMRLVIMYANLLGHVEKAGLVASLVEMLEKGTLGKPTPSLDKTWHGGC